jgi:hypothetical protein
LPTTSLYPGKFLFLILSFSNLTPHSDSFARACPVCHSDAFMVFGKKSNAVDNPEIRDATNHLLNTVIPG